MTIILTFENGQKTLTNVSESFTMDMVNECFLNKNFKGLGIVSEVNKSKVDVY